jgi:hypothetical protein
MISDEEKLVEMVLEADLLPTKVREVKISNNIVMITEPENKYLEFVKKTGIRYLFYIYTYYDVEKYLIPYDWYSDYAKTFKVVIQNHNQSLKELDFRVPYKLTLFMLLDGTYIGAEYQDEWLAALGIDEAEKEFEKIETKFYHEVL